MMGLGMERMEKAWEGRLRRRMAGCWVRVERERRAFWVSRIRDVFLKGSAGWKGYRC